MKIIVFASESESKREALTETNTDKTQTQTHGAYDGVNRLLGIFLIDKLH